MKTQQMYTFAFLLGATVLSAQSVAVYADIRGKSCNGGSRFCSTTISQSSGNKTVQNAITLSKIADDSLQIIINTKLFSANELAKMTVEKEEIFYLYIANDIPLEIEICEALNLAENTVIPEGYYRYEKYDDNYLTTINLK